MTNTDDFPVWLEVPHGARFIVVGEFPQAVAAAILRSRAEATEQERSALTDEWAGNLSAEIERGTIGVHDPATEERMSEPPIGDELRKSKIRIQVAEALLATKRIGLKFIRAAESKDAPPPTMPLDPIAVAIARGKELAAMSQDDRRKAQDERRKAGLPVVSAASKPLSTTRPSAMPPPTAFPVTREASSATPPAQPAVSEVEGTGKAVGAIQEFKAAARDEMGELIERIVAERPAASESEVWRELLALAKATAPPLPLLEVVDGEIKWRNSSTDKVSLMSRRTFNKRWERRVAARTRTAPR